MVLVRCGSVVVVWCWSGGGVLCGWCCVSVVLVVVWWWSHGGHMVCCGGMAWHVCACVSRYGLNSKLYLCIKTFSPINGHGT